MRILFSAILLAAFSLSVAQAPSNVKWHYIRTNHFDVVYPVGFDTTAQDVANLMERLYDPVSQTQKTKPKKIKLFLYNQASISNGWVGLAPRHSAYFSTPSSDVFGFGNVEWYERLGIHEYRHVSQYSFVNKNFLWYMNLFFGDYGLAYSSTLSIPDWYFEGDAVMVESIANQNGRGNIPNFLHPHKAIAYTKKRYKYAQSHFGSYRTYYDNHYSLGYLLSSYIYSHGDENTWYNVMNQATRYAWIPYKFSYSLHKQTGMNLQKTYKVALQEAKAKWDEQTKNLNITDYESISKNNKYWSEYYNLSIYKGTLYAKKTSIDHRPQIVQISNGKETSVYSNDLSDEVSINNNIVCWASSVPDMRWTMQSFSDIFYYNLNTKKKTQLTKKGKYFSPSLSPDNTKIAAVEFDINRRTQIVLFDKDSKQTIKTFPTQDNAFATYLHWDNDGKSIYYTLNKDGMASIVRTDIGTGKTETLLPYTKENISYPYIYSKYLYFNSPITGIDAIHALDMGTGKRYLVASTKFGCRSAYVTKDSLYYVALCEKGSEVAGLINDDRGYIPLEDAKKFTVTFHKEVEKYEPDFESIIADTDSTQTYTPKKYNQLLHSFNFHSRSITTDPYSLGVSFLSTDAMSTLGLQTGYMYNYKYKKGAFQAEVLYNKYLVRVGAGASAGRRMTAVDDSTHLLWNERNYFLYASLPLDFSKNNYNCGLTIGTQLSALNISDNETKVTDTLRTGNEIPAYRTGYNIFEGNVTILKSTVEFSLFQKAPARAIKAPLGFGIGLGLYNSFGGTFNSSIATESHIIGRVPTFRHHTLELGLSYETQSAFVLNSADYQFETSATLLRGIDYFYSNKNAVVSADYTFPIVCPDFNFIDLFYIKRIYGNLFLDYGTYSLNDNRGQAAVDITSNTYGADLNMECFFLGIKMPFDLGLRFAKNSDEGTYYTGLVLGIEAN